MALAIDTSEIIDEVNLYNWVYATGYVPFEGRFQVYRACAVATVIQDALSNSRLDLSRPPARQEALDWQADPDCELKDVEVLHHLCQQAESSPLLRAAVFHTDSSTASTTVMTSCAFPLSSLPARAKGRPLSSFHRNSIRYSWIDTPITRNRLFSRSSDAVSITLLPWWPHPNLQLAERSSAAPCRVHQSDHVVVWQLQFDVVDFSKRMNHPNSHLQRRRRSTIDYFHRVSAPRIQGDPPSDSRKETKLFRGVRYREDHKRWTAEMKPPKNTKVHFGEFKSQTQAARVVDVAFHYYGKPLNFSDTPNILEERPVPANINAEDKLNFVKEQAKWVSSIYTTLPLPPHSDREVDGEGDDDTSQPQLSLPHEATAGLVNFGMAEDSLGVAEVAGGFFITNTSEAQQGLPEWRASDSTTCSMCIVENEDEDGAEHSTGPASINLRSPSEPSSDSHGQFDDDEQVMTERMNAKRPRLSISAHHLIPSHQVAVADSPWRACTAATPVFSAAFSPCPSDGNADQGDHGMCVPQPWDNWDPMAGSREPNGVVADGVDEVLTGTLQEQQALSVRNVENLLCPFFRSPSSFIDIREGDHRGAHSSATYGIPLQFSFESQGMPMNFLMMSPPLSIPSSPTPLDFLPDGEQCLRELQGFGPDWISG